MSFTLSPADQKTVIVALQCFDSQPKVDFEKMRQMLGSTSVGATKVRWYTCRKGILGGEGGGDVVEGGTKGKGRKRKVDEVEKEDDEERKDSVSPGPAKKGARKSQAKKTTQPSSDANEDSDDPLQTTIPPRPIKRARKPKPAPLPKPKTPAKKSNEGDADDFSDNDSSVDQKDKAGQSLKIKPKAATKKPTQGDALDDSSNEETSWAGLSAGPAKRVSGGVADGFKGEDTDRVVQGKLDKNRARGLRDEDSRDGDVMASGAAEAGLGSDEGEDEDEKYVDDFGAELKAFARMAAGA